MPRSAHEVLDQEFLQVRAKILELAAFFDRLSEADASNVNQDQLQRLQDGCAILNDQDTGKAERVQLLFSREYDANWRNEFAI